jgi:hypothetical protein
MQNRARANWIISALLFGGFLLSLWLDLTGLTVHQWLGLAVGALAVYHLAAHRRWVIAVTERFFGRTSQQARAFYLVDTGLAAGFLAIIVTGLVISSWFGLALTGYTSWLTIHIVASVTTLALVVVKIGLHWRWIVSTARKHLLPVPSGHGAAQPNPITMPNGRRDFLRLMGGVGAVALLGDLHALSSLERGEAEASTASANQTTGGVTTRSSGSSVLRASSGNSTACTVQCNLHLTRRGQPGFDDLLALGRLDAVVAAQHLVQRLDGKIVIVEQVRTKGKG